MGEQFIYTEALMHIYDVLMVGHGRRRLDKPSILTLINKEQREGAKMDWMIDDQSHFHNKTYLDMDTNFSI